MDSSYTCDFNDSALTGKAKGSKFEANMEIKDKGLTHHVNIYDVYYLESHGNYVKVHTANRLHLLRQTLQALETELDNSLFLRIHRSLLVNINYISKVNSPYR